MKDYPARRIEGLAESTHMYDTLRGKRNFGLDRAKMAAKMFGTSVEVWRDPQYVADRKIAWNKYHREKDNADGQDKV